ncbi:Metalloendopeptidase OMA1, mitochondrial [Dufourea novaeangliae]|uniref:Metalloendopeptidase OMA1, mitochondrial n=1 Tax=Dufourea novaeangliae TaxID=178035 RepID=A0A154PLQ2_DUFNO|nr:Metalloendopeptidase OMA1, mitochondrial [Dufourea novaeangliae]
MLYSVNTIYLKHLQHVTIRTIISTSRSLSCGISPETPFIQSRGYERSWQYARLQRANFHTTQRLHVSPFTVLLVCSALPIGAIFTGSYARHFWIKLTPIKQQQYKKWYWERRNTFFGSLSLFSSLLLIYWLTHLERDVVEKRRRFIMFDKDQQAELGTTIFTMLLTKHRNEVIPINDPMYLRLSRILRKLVKSNKEVFENTEWTVSIVNEPSPNAMALPGGNVIVFSGLFDIIQNDDQLTFILAHEMSHVMLSHVVELFSYKVITEIVYTIPAFLIWACFSKWKAFVLYLGVGLLHNIFFVYPYKRRVEAEADKVGFRLAAKTCIDLREVLIFWELMERYGELTGENKFAIPLLLTHPSHKKREKWLARQMPGVLVLRDQAGCPDLPLIDPRDKLSRYLEELEKRFHERNMFETFFGK